LAIFFKTTHSNPVFLLVLWFTSAASPCPHWPIGTEFYHTTSPHLFPIYTGLPRARSACHLLARCFADILQPWIWRRYVPPKRRVPLNALHGVISQKKILFKFTSVHRTLYSTRRNCFIRRIAACCSVVTASYGWSNVWLRLSGIRQLERWRFSVLGKHFSYHLQGYIIY
jgi:hypothetical protein